jgi:hypothetical protein
MRLSSAPITKLSPFDTLRAVVDSNLCLARFGDGEIAYSLQGKRLRFQRWHRALAEKLEEILLAPHNRVLVAYNHIFTSTDEVRLIARYDRYGKKFDRYETLVTPDDIGILQRRRARRNYLRCWDVIAAETNVREFGEAFGLSLSLYVEEYKHGEMEKVRNKFRQLFERRRILFVVPAQPSGGPSFAELEPDMRRIGLLSAQYVSIPAAHAYEHAEEIVGKILNHTSFDDVFIQAGPTATWMAAALAEHIDGRVLDVGGLNTQVRHLL